MPSNLARSCSRLWAECVPASPPFWSHPPPFVLYSKSRPAASVRMISKVDFWRNNADPKLSDYGEFPSNLPSVGSVETPDWDSSLRALQN